METMKEIKLTQGKVAKVDDHLFDELNKFKWFAAKCVNGGFYARRLCNGKILHMHRHILGITEKSVHVDHEDGDSLNNQMYNIRRATHKENIRNRGITKRSTCGFKGVFWEKSAKRWRAQLSFEGRKIHLGLFHDINDAARAYNKAIIVHHGKFARLNEIPA